MYYKAIKGTETFEEYGNDLIPSWVVGSKEFGNQRRKEIDYATAEDVAEAINACTEWDINLCEALCELADMSDEWDAAEEDFENVIYAAAEKLGVEV